MDQCPEGHQCQICGHATFPFGKIKRQCFMQFISLGMCFRFNENYNSEKTMHSLKMHEKLNYIINFTSTTIRPLPNANLHVILSFYLG
uniref:Uncharacterized protein n=1 Tax=Rhizophora mucronata TaxID=61149 RepID=A0A2P2QQ49_RHIMU